MNAAKAPQRVETSRLTLIRPARDDAPEIFARYASDEEVTRYLGWPRHRTLNDTYDFLSFSDATWETWPAGPYVIRSREDHRLLGGTGFAFPSADEAITGYVLAKDSWGCGYATEALSAIVEIARGIEVVSLAAFCHPDHRASARVLEKCGFRSDAAWSDAVSFPNLRGGVLVTPLRFELSLAPTA